MIQKNLRKLRGNLYKYQKNAIEEVLRSIPNGLASCEIVDYKFLENWMSGIGIDWWIPNYWIVVQNHRVAELHIDCPHFYHEDNKKKVIEIPACIGELQSLNTLKINHFNLQKFPESIGKLTQLNNLFLTYTNLQHLPKSIGNLKILTMLNLSNNNLDIFPKSILKLTNLKYLSLSNNNIQKIPESVSNLKSLEYLNIEGNPLKSIPNSIKNSSITIRKFYMNLIGI